MSGTVFRGPLAGTSSVEINGTTWNVVGECQYSVAGSQNETLKGQSAVEGFSQMPKQGYWSATLRDRRDIDGPSTYQGASGLTVICQMANGKIITVDDGWQVEEIAVNTQEGTFELRIDSASVVVDVVG
ncbi:phage tail tube protein [Acetobacter nitrogenifigens DSM 23921 = NBRC 105050]|uniref:Phage tail protein n=1 Tax=Acetobacter nitrogenifigens DSM 23921 = NBRC 105050 TaxID=1120919 RepID=A0A511X5A2_9PROT|nr:phage tail tube protein [Acetobacter nitrogenifigens]GBQ92090.1 phage tail tube protein [Acetobacter nitrogenifigens DSM 23921 = NBRC 105050]GEN58129.1 hypothetical protein ANI02nite_00130 [Acetobacter nitrogenifigens DSM 23921 = NBRC 105050]